jgi:nitroreductase
MEFFDLIQKRYSVRAFESKKVEKEKLEKIVEAARLAPTAANRQPMQIMIIETAGRKEELAKLYPREWFLQAPLLIGIFVVKSQAWTRRDGKNYGDVDAAIAMDHLILAAADQGLGTCWIAAFDPQAARELFGLPDDVEPVAFTPLGYPADKPKPKERKPLAQLIKYERW